MLAGVFDLESVMDNGSLRFIVIDGSTVQEPGATTKSMLEVDELRGRKDSQLAELYLHGKLLYAAVIEKLMRNRFACAATSMDAPRELTHWRLCRTVAEETDSGLKACFPMKNCFIQACIKRMTERPRKRKLQSLPDSVILLIGFCRQQGLSCV